MPAIVRIIVLCFALVVSSAVSATAGPQDRAAPGQQKKAGPAVAPAATGDDTCSDPYSAVGFSLPSWADAQWRTEEYYSTIQTADITGDGPHELIGRLPDGLHAHTFDVNLGQWKPLYPGAGPTPLFSDEAGWEQPKYYSTIQTGDLDGDGAAEVFARAANGIVSYRFNAADGTWESLPLLDEFVGTPDAGLRRSYSTIQAADLDGDGKDEIVGRIASGIEAYGYDAKTGWTAMPDLSWLPDTGPFVEPEYYSTLQTADITGDGGADLFARTPSGIEGYDYDPSTGWVALPALELFTDEAGWTKPQYYATIQTADLDGNGQADLFGRGVDGIVAFVLDTAANETSGGTWRRLPVLDGSFADSGGWSDPQYYETIQAGDVDGDGRDEVIGRAANGVQAWSLDRSARRWEQVASGGVFTDASGWSAARSFSTIGTADVDGFAALGTGKKTTERVEIVGRGPTGVETYRFDPKAPLDSRWVSPSAGFPDFSTGSAAKAYAAINATLGSQPDVTNPDFDVRSEYPKAISSDVLGKWQTAVEGMGRPSGVSRNVWTQVQSQIATELGFASSVASWFEYQKDFITKNFTAQNMDLTADWIDDTSDTQVDSEVGSLLAGIVKAVGVAGGPPGSAAGGALAAAISAGTTAATNAKLEAFEGTYMEVKSTISDAFQEASCGNTRAKQAVMSDFGQLSLVGQLVLTAEWNTLGTDEPLAPALRAFAVWVWQTFAPTLSWFVGSCDQANLTCDWVLKQGGSDWPLLIADGFFTDALGGGFVSIEPADQSLRDKLFESGPSDCETVWDIDNCGVDVPYEDVFLSRNGWALTCLEGTDFEGYCDARDAAIAAWRE